MSLEWFFSRFGLLPSEAHNFGTIDPTTGTSSPVPFHGRCVDSTQDLPPFLVFFIFSYSPTLPGKVGGHSKGPTDHRSGHDPPVSGLVPTTVDEGRGLSVTNSVTRT